MVSYRKCICMLDRCQPHLGHALDMCCTCVGHMWDIRWACIGHVLANVWAWLAHVGGMVGACVGVCGTSLGYIWSMCWPGACVWHTGYMPRQCVENDCVMFGQLSRSVWNVRKSYSERTEASSLEHLSHKQRQHMKVNTQGAKPLQQGTWREQHLAYLGFDKGRSKMSQVW